MERACLEVLDAAGTFAVAAACDVGDAMLDVCDEVRAGVPFGCRGATCGTCVVEVVDGADALEPPSPLELSVLRHHGVGSTDRLACRAVFAAPRLVRVRARRPASR